MEYLIGIVLGLLLLAGLWFGAKRMVHRALTGAFTGLFDQKSKVLRDAAVNINSFSPAPHARSEGEFDDVDMAQWLDAEELAVEQARHAAAVAADARRVWWYVDVSITPRPVAGPFTLWEPGELILGAPGVDPRRAMDGMDDDGDPGPAPAVVHGVKVWEGGRFRTDRVGKYGGPQRLRLHVGVLPEVARRQLRYYFESLGEIQFPDPPAGEGS